MVFRKQSNILCNAVLRRNSLPTQLIYLILCLILSAIISKASIILSVFVQFRSKLTSYPFCTAPVWLIVQSESEHSLKLFLRQFSKELLGICLLLETKYVLKEPTPSYVEHISWGSLPEYYERILQNAKTVVVLGDDVYFYLSEYGVGKGEVSQNLIHNTSSLPFEQLLQTIDIRIAPSSKYLTNAAAILHRKRIFTRGIPFFKTLYDEPESPVVFESLPLMNSTVKFPIVHHIPTSFHDCHPSLARFQRNERRERSVSEVYGTRMPESNTPIALAFRSPALAPLPRAPVQYSRSAFWALASQLLQCNTADRVYDDIISGLVLQRVLWESDDSLLVVHPTLDIINSKAAGEILPATDNLLQDTIFYLRILSVPTRIRTLPKVFEYVCNYLVKKNILNLDAVQRSIIALRNVPVLDIARTHTYIPSQQNQEPLTAVCITGQMRSAPFTYFNILSTLHDAISSFDVFVVAPMDDRASSAVLFNATTVQFSSKPHIHDIWVRDIAREARSKKLLHETLYTDAQVRNYLLQLWDMRTCLSIIERHERHVGTRYDYIARVRPDILFMNNLNASWWRNVVVSGSRHSFYGMNDRFFIGPRKYMGRILSCHDLFSWLLKTSQIHGKKLHQRVLTRRINSERFLARCALFKKVEVKLEPRIDVRRVAWSKGIARWREF